jgi:cytochrome b561
MPLKNTKAEFGTITKTFHWVMALLVISLLAVGLYMTGMELSPDKFKVYGLHKSFGIVVLVLVSLRVLWRIFSTQPDALPTHKKSEKILAKLAHLGLYCGMIVMPITGWLMSSAKGFSVSVFNSYTLPDLIKPNEKLAELFEEIHELAAFTLIAVIFLHFAGAVKHHVIDKDITLKRMLPNFKKQG